MHSFRHLEIIQALATHRNFGRAATALGMSQPVLSRTLAYIEKDLGIKLFERGSGVTEPTIFGQIIVDRCGATLDEITAALREIRLIQDLQAGSIGVAAGIFPSEISVHTALGRLAARHPKLNIAVTTEVFLSARREVLENRADIAIADISDLLPHGHPDLDIEPLSPRNVHFCCRADHPVFRRGQPTLDSVFQFPFVGSVFPRRVNHLLPSDLSRAGAIEEESGYFRPRVEEDSLRGALEIARESDCITIAHPSYIQADIKARRLRLIDMHFSWMALHYGFVTRKGRTPAPAVVEFMKIVREIENAIP